jgi:hypothetical protein
MSEVNFNITISFMPRTTGNNMCGICIISADYDIGEIPTKFCDVSSTVFRVTTL